MIISSMQNLQPKYCFIYNLFIFLSNDVCILSGTHQSKAKIIGFVLKKDRYLHNTTLPLPLHCRNLSPHIDDLE